MSESELLATLKKAILYGELSTGDAAKIIEEHRRDHQMANGLNQNNAAANIGPMVGGGCTPAAPSSPYLSQDQLQSIVWQAQAAVYDPSYAGTTPQPSTPAEWLRQHTAALDALKEVFEFFAAQDNMDLFRGKPVHQQIYRTIMANGIRSLTDKK